MNTRERDELNCKVAQVVFGWKWYGPESRRYFILEAPEYSSPGMFEFDAPDPDKTINAYCDFVGGYNAVIEKMGQLGYTATIMHLKEEGVWSAAFGPDFEFDASIGVAICLAALKRKEQNAEN